MSQTLPPPLFDPFAPGFTDDPYPQYAALRAAAPVYRHPLGFWLLTCYGDVSWLLRASMSVEDRNIAASPLVELREQMYGEEAARPHGVSMLDRDPPDHTRLRRLVSKAFTPRAVQALRPRICGLVDSMLDEAEREGRVDLVDALAFPLPFAVIAEMLGTPPADHERIRQLSGTVVRGLEPVADPALAAAIDAADAELTAVAADMIAWKRANPADDLLTALINAEARPGERAPARLVRRRAAPLPGRVAGQARGLDRPRAADHAVSRARPRRPGHLERPDQPARTRAPAGIARRVALRSGVSRLVCWCSWRVSAREFCRGDV